MKSYQLFWRDFKNSFLQQANQTPIYLTTRHHMGSYIALFMSIYNLFHLRQRVLKNAIFITKSNNPYIVKSASILIGSFYFIGLYSLWHIPSIGTQIAVRVYLASQVATTNLIVKQNKERILYGTKLTSILQKQGLKI